MRWAYTQGGRGADFTWYFTVLYRNPDTNYPCRHIWFVSSFYPFNPNLSIGSKFRLDNNLEEFHQRLTKAAMGEGEEGAEN